MSLFIFVFFSFRYSTMRFIPNVISYWNNIYIHIYLWVSWDPIGFLSQVFLREVFSTKYTKYFNNKWKGTEACSLISKVRSNSWDWKTLIQIAILIRTFPNHSFITYLPLLLSLSLVKFNCFIFHIYYFTYSMCFRLEKVIEKTLTKPGQSQSFFVRSLSIHLFLYAHIWEILVVIFLLIVCYLLSLPHSLWQHLTSKIPIWTLICKLLLTIKDHL